MPRISIITTTYKHKDFIAQTIESVLSQTYVDWEMLIGDDSPDNNSWGIIQTYVKKYPDKIKAWRHSPNKGIVENTNFLIDQISAESDYISFLEGDDMYTQDNLEEKIKVFEKYPEVELVYSDLSFINKDGNIILESFFAQRNIAFYRNQIIPIHKYILAPAGPICSRSTAVIKKQVAKKYLPIINLIPSKKSYSVSDRDFYFRISTKEKVYGINKPLTHYRRHSANLSANGTSEDLMILLQYYFKKGFIDKHLYNKKCSRCSIVSCIFALEVQDKKKSYHDRKSSFHYSFFSFPLWKIGIIGLLILPKRLSKIILNKLIKRG